MRVRRYIKLSALVLVLCLFAMLTLFSGALYTYSVLTDEALVAELEFSEIGPQHYRAELVTDGGCKQRSFELFGDQWRLDARFLKWHSWATLLGFDAYYRLSRLEGRYVDVAEQNSQPNVAYSLADDPALDLVDLAAGMGRFNIFVDSTYGSSTFQTADPEYVHRVYRTQTGLIARREARPQRRDSTDAMLVEIRSACGAGPGYWERFTTWIDRGVAGAFGRQAAG